MNSIFITLSLYSLLFHAVLAYHNGAPDLACVTMTPGHGTLAQTASSPYQVTVDESYYKAGKAVNVTIKSSGSDVFDGILVQAREANKNAAIGTFSDDLPSDVNHLACNNPKGAVTHSKKLGLTSITLKWLPPNKLSGLGNISFFATVVENKATFWVKLESPKLSPMEDMDGLKSTTMMADPSKSMDISTMIHSTKTTPLPEVESSVHKTTCAPKKCVANASPPNLLLLVSSAFLLLLASTVF